MVKVSHCAGTRGHADSGYAAVMLRITQAPNAFLATLWADALRAEGIEASVQRQYLGSAAGELPPDQCLPEVWIENPHHLDRAQQVLHHLQHMPQHRWFCVCGELVEGGFQQCWNCAALMPD
jgi:hypothetical protein